MDVKFEQQGGVGVVSVTGSIDSQTAPTLAAALSERIAAGSSRLVADLREVDYTSSAGLRALLGALKEARQKGGDFRLAGVQRNVLKVLELSGFTSILKHYGDVPEAVASFGG